MGALAGIVLIIAMITLPLGTIAKRAGDTRNANIWYSVGSVCLVMFVFLLLALAL